jgi:hypothetical protein
MFVGLVHIGKITRGGIRQQRFGLCVLKGIFRLVPVVCLFILAGCSGPAVVESSATAVSVRYDSVVNSLEDATQLAQKACALHHKTARLRNTANFGLRERYGHFDCV